MGLGKDVIQMLKTTKSIPDAYDAVRRVASSLNLKEKEAYCEQKAFSVHVAEPMKWLSTNYPVHITINAETLQDGTMLTIKANSKMFSITQDVNTNSVLNNFVNSIKAFL
jgi:hypothetical protein